jgi:hypothetical protein
MHEQLHEYVGVIHIHSTYSDGSRSIPDIAAIAAEVDLDYLLMTDHNTLQPQRDGLEGWYDGVLVGIGYEINDANDLNHYLAFRLEKEVADTTDPAVYVEQVKQLGGFGFIAHPDEKRSAMKKYPPYPWTLWESDSFNGIEIWNQMSEWLEGLTNINKYWRVFNPRKSIISPMEETLQNWDEVNKKKKVVGIGGVDAHGHIYKLMGFLNIIIFRYKVLFKTIRTHILTDKALMGHEDYREDLNILYENLLNCRCFISNYYCGDARGFRFYAENKSRIVHLGGEIEFDKRTHLHVNLPRTAITHLIKNGEKITSKKGRDLVFEIDNPGIYRVEVYYLNRPWIFSNHIRIMGKI